MYGPDLARVHHQGFGFLAEAAAAHLLVRLQEQRLYRGTVIDLGCGSGLLSQAVSAAGYDVIGIDVSEAMLDIARRHAPKANFVRSSIDDFEYPNIVAATAIGECFNYSGASRASIDRLQLQARRIATALLPKGIFLLDIASQGRNGPQPKLGYASSSDEWLCVYRTVEDEKAKTLVHQITTFVRIGELYRRRDEEHRLELFAPESVEAALANAGLKVTTHAGYGDQQLGPGWYVYEGLKKGFS